MTGGRVLADYWSGHGHAGPSHGAERDAIAWGTPGDFMRCVTMVSEHMTPEQAKGYCNERHHDALGIWPSQHAAAERGKMTAAAISFTHVVAALAKAADGGAESRVPVGSITGGQFTTGSDGPSTAPKKPNPYADGKKKPASKTPARGSKAPAKASAKPSTPKPKDNDTVSQLRSKLGDLDQQLDDLYTEKKKLEATGVSNFGTSTASTGSSSSTGAASTASTSSTPAASTSSTASGSSTSSTGSSSSSSSSASSDAAKAKLVAVNDQIASVRANIKGTKEAIQQAKNKSSKALEVDLAKVGPHGFIHGWIKEGAANGTGGEGAKALSAVNRKASLKSDYGPAGKAYEVDRKSAMDATKKADASGKAADHATAVRAHMKASKSADKAQAEAMNANAFGKFDAAATYSKRSGAHTAVAQAHVTYPANDEYNAHDPSGEMHYPVASKGDTTHPADRMTIASSPKATAKGLSDDELETANTEFARRATMLGKTGQVSKAHGAVKSEIAARAGTSKGVSNVREKPSGRFRVFQGHVAEARRAIKEGRHSDAAEHLNAARQSAPAEHRAIVGAVSDLVTSTVTDN